MKKLIVSFLITLLCSSSLFADAESKIETELKINLTKEGYLNLREKFLNSFSGEQEKRSDYYFEIFTNGYYQLKRLTPAIKLRLMAGADTKWQVQQTEKTWTTSIFSVKETTSQTLQLTSTDSLFTKINSYHQELEQLNPSALTLATQIQKYFKDNGLVTMSQSLCTQCKNENHFYSSYMNQKKRVKIKLKLGDDKLNLQIGETLNRDVVTYEIEAEIKESKNLDKTALAFKDWLTQQGFKSAHIDSSEAVDLSAKSESDLRKLHSL